MQRTVPVPGRMKRSIEALVGEGRYDLVSPDPISPEDLSMAGGDRCRRD